MSHLFFVEGLQERKELVGMGHEGRRVSQGPQADRVHDIRPVGGNNIRQQIGPCQFFAFASAARLAMTLACAAISSAA